MEEFFFLIIVGYFAAIGFLQVALLLVRAFRKPEPPRGRLYLALPEDPELTEGTLSYYCRKKEEDEGLPGGFATILPQNEEAAEICRKFCRAHGIKVVDCSGVGKVL